MKFGSWALALLATMLVGGRTAGYAGNEVPAGTVVVVRTTGGIDVREARNGQKFEAVVDDEVLVDGKALLSEGDRAVLVLVKGSAKDPKEIGLRLDSLWIKGREYQVRSLFAEVATEKKRTGTAKTTAIASGVGAAVGAVVAGGNGALIGAGAGAGAGLILSTIDGSREIPAETRLSLALRDGIALK